MIEYRGCIIKPRPAFSGQRTTSKNPAFNYYEIWAGGVYLTQCLTKRAAKAVIRQRFRQPTDKKRNKQPVNLSDYLTKVEYTNGAAR